MSQPGRSGQLIPDSKLSASLATAGASHVLKPSLARYPHDCFFLTR